MILKKWNTNLRLEYSARQNRTVLFRCSIAPGTLLLERPNKPYSIHFPTRFSWNFLRIVNNRGLADTSVYFLQNGKGLDEKPTKAVDRPSVSFWSPRFFSPLSSFGHFTCLISNAVWQTAGKWSLQHVHSVKISSSNLADKFTLAKIKNSSNKTTVVELASES